jgi:hypothetical protein
MRQLDIGELAAVAAIAEVNKRGAVVLVAPGGEEIKIFPPDKIPASLYERIARYFEPIRTILLARAAATRRHGRCRNCGHPRH